MIKISLSLYNFILYSAHANLLECRYVSLEWYVGHPDIIEMKEFKINTYVYVYIVIWWHMCIAYLETDLKCENVLKRW